MPDQKKENFKRIKIEVPVEVHRKYHEACEKVYGNTRSGIIPLRTFILGFIRENSKAPKIK